MKWSITIICMAVNCQVNSHGGDRPTHRPFEQCCYLLYVYSCECFRSCSSLRMGTKCCGTAVDLRCTTLLTWDMPGDQVIIGNNGNIMCCFLAVILYVQNHYSLLSAAAPCSIRALNVAMLVLNLLDKTNMLERNCNLIITGRFKYKQYPPGSFLITGVQIDFAY